MDADKITRDAMIGAVDGPKKRRPRYRARYLNRKAVHDLVLRRAELLGRGDVIERVGDELYVYLDAIVERNVDALVRQHPSGFKTLQPYTPNRYKET